MFRKLLIGATLLGVLFYSKAAARPDINHVMLTEVGSQVVMLTSPSNHNHGGTGFEIRSPSGRVLTVTNAHVCGVAENGVVTAHVGYRTLNLRVLDIATTTDLCLLEGIPYASGLHIAEGMDPRATIYSVGHPLLRALTVSAGHPVSRGIIDIMEPEREAPECKGPGRSMRPIQSPFGTMHVCFREVDAWETSMVIYPGNSGSPVVNADFEVVGVVFAGMGGTNYGSFIPLDVLKAFIAAY